MLLITLLCYVLNCHTPHTHTPHTVTLPTLSHSHTVTLPTLSHCHTVAIHEETKLSRWVGGGADCQKVHEVLHTSSARFSLEIYLQMVHSTIHVHVVVWFPDLIWRVYQYNAPWDTESDPHWGRFWVWDRD